MSFGLKHWLKTYLTNSRASLDYYLSNLIEFAHASVITVNTKFTVQT